jgi:hypothetical protein
MNTTTVNTETATTTRRPGRPQSVTVRLEDRGYSSACHIWQGSTNGNGYGTINREGFRGYAHRYTYLRENGEIPEGCQLDHKCLQRLCCNPDHLEPVSPAENVRRSAVAKLRPRDVQTIRALYADRRNNPITQRELARAFGITQAQVSHIVRRRQWN